MPCAPSLLHAHAAHLARGRGRLRAHEMRVLGWETCIRRVPHPCCTRMRHTLRAVLGGPMVHPSSQPSATRGRPATALPGSLHQLALPPRISQ
jgi:hypothetical protein